MSNILKLTLICSLIFHVLMGKAAGVGELKQIKENYWQMLIPSSIEQDSLLSDLIKIKPEKEMSDQAVVELHQLYPFDLKKIDGYLSLMSADGSWTDINYADTKRSGWEPKLHAERILELSKLYYSKTTEYYHSEKVKEAIHLALKYWFDTKPRCLNWWYNQIGIPKTLGAAFILLEEQLTDREHRAAVAVMENAKFGMTGQNKVWLAGNVLIRALLQNDADLVKAARDAIASEIVLGRKEGIKDDWSFHQHGPQQQFGNYGLSFVTGMSFFFQLFKDTDYEFTGQQREILVSLIDKGYRWVIWNRYMDVSSLGRQFFHNAQIHKAYSLAFAAEDMGLAGFPAHGNTLIGHKHFDDSDYTVHRSKDWMSSVKMASRRVIGTELVNEDNLKGYYLGDGATYYYVRGDEYLEVFPFWDWRKIPGVTSYEDIAPMPDVNVTRSGNNSDLVGGLSNGKIGMTAMELNRDGLEAHKVWLFADKFVFCLGADIHSDTTLCVTTSIDQRSKSGELYVWNKKKWSAITGAEAFRQKDLRFFHDAVGYIVLDGDTCVAQSEEREGRWSDFMGMYTPATLHGEVAALHLRHGVKPSGASYQYIVLPAATKKEVEEFDPKMIRVIKNDKVAQVISSPSCREGYWMAVYQSENFDIEGLFFKAVLPGIYYVEKGLGGLEIKLSSPFRISK